VTRQLARREILDRGLPLKWWSEFQQDLPVYTVAAAAFVVPSGFLTDGASVPRPVWALLANSDPDILYPAFAHDYLYAVWGKIPNGLTLTRQQCDETLRELMQAIGAPAWKAGLVYAAVRAGGKAAWDRDDTKKLLFT
jgi:hypothetical protein